VLIALTSMLVFAAGFFLTIAVRHRPMDPVEARLRAVQSGLRPRNPALSQPFVRRAMGPMAGGLVRFILRFLPPSWIKATDQKLTYSGGRLSLPGFVLIWAAAAVGFAMMGWLIGAAFLSGVVFQIAGAAAGLGLGGFLPQFWLNARVSERNYQARKALPDALDLMTTSVEAGLSLDAALVRVAEYQAGPFQSELLIALQDMSLGKSRRQALEEITTRLHVAEVVNFVQTINQAEVTGAPIGQVLRVQAEQVRIDRRQAAEAQAQRAPLLMLIPLILFIFPSLFIVLLAPAAMTIIDLLSSGSFE
jgi:tight adherence protein C